MHSICNGSSAHTPEQQSAILATLAPRQPGLGDLIAGVAQPIAQAVGMKPCKGCDQRHAGANQLLPAGHWLNKLAAKVLPAPQYLDIPTTLGADPPTDTPPTIPIVYVYWHTGAQGDELRWSMRSVQQHLTGGTPDIHLVGAKPPWYSGQWLPVKRVRPCRHRKFRDSLNKLYQACLSPDTPDEFFWWMDDVYLMRPTTVDQLRVPRHYGRLRPGQRRSSNEWQQLLQETADVIEQHGLTAHQWGTHLPHWISKSRFLAIWDKYQLASRTLIWELLYGAEYYDASQSRSTRGFFRRYLTADSLSGLTTNSEPVINNGQRAWKEPLRAYLYASFPTKADHETDACPAPRWHAAPGVTPVTHTSTESITTISTEPTHPAILAPCRDGRPSPWLGAYERKPWDYRVQLVAAHLNTPDLIADWLALWQAQTERPWITLIDTGSTPENLAALMAFESQSENVEVHSLRCRGFRHPSEPVAMALDFAAALNQQDVQLHTHVDVFPMRQTIVAELLEQCTAETPVVGYEISPRDHVEGFLADNWRGMVGHTLTALHVPTIRRLDCVWSMRRAYERHGLPLEPLSSNDTEVGFNLDLRAAGVTPVLIGHDENYRRQITEHYDHCRSFTGSAIYDSNYHQTAAQWVTAALAAARERLQQWTA